MKKKANFGLLMLALAVMCSCSDVEDDVDINIITNGDVSFTISKGYKRLMNEETPGNGSYKYDVSLIDNNLALSDSTGYTGTGSAIKFTVVSNNNFDIAPGKYTIDGFNSNDSLTAQNCVVYTGYNFAADTGNVSTITGGIIEFVNMGATIKIRLHLVENYSSSMFEGTFQGILENASN